MIRRNANCDQKRHNSHSALSLSSNRSGHDLKKGEDLLDKVCLHIDTTSNAVLSRGLVIEDFVSVVVHKPSNLLLLDTTANQGEYEPHTGMKIVRGNLAVTNYFNLLQKRNSLREIKWIDFSDIAMLKELSPIEISELLYLGHTRTNLRSPFFYKLQNNFVYFEYNNDTARVYYRNLDEFYKILANKLAKLLEQKINEKRLFFKKGPEVAPVNVLLLKKMKTIFQDGVCFDFRELTNKEANTFVIPVHVVEDRFWNSTPKQKDLVGNLIYDLEAKAWSVEIADESSPLITSEDAKLHSLY